MQRINVRGMIAGGILVVYGLGVTLSAELRAGIPFFIAGGFLFAYNCIEGLAQKRRAAESKRDS